MRRYYWIGLCAGIAFAVRAAALRSFPVLDGDSAVFALMAKHIHELREFPVYMWENHYAGSLMSYLGAVLFAVFGVSTPVFLLAGALVSCCWAVCGWLMCRRFCNAAGLVAAALAVALPPPRVLLLSMFTGGVHAENLLMGTLILWAALVFSPGSRYNLRIVLLGALCGFGLWQTPGVFPFAVTAFSVACLRSPRNAAAGAGMFVCGIIAGALPAVFYNITHPAATLLRLGGRMFYLDRGDLGTGFIASAWHGLVMRFFSVGGSLLRMPSLVLQLLGVFNTVLLSCSLVWVVVDAVRGTAGKERSGWLRPLAVSAVIFIVFYAVAVGEDAPRYMLPLYVLAPCSIGWMVTRLAAWRKPVAFAVIALLAAHNGVISAVTFSRAGTNTYGVLSQCLLRQEVRFAYADYWTAYPVIFESGENVLVAPVLCDQRISEHYPAYTAAVQAAGTAAGFIIDTQGPAAPSGAPAEALRQAVAGGARRVGCGRFIVYVR